MSFGCENPALHQCVYRPYLLSSLAALIESRKSAQTCAPLSYAGRLAGHLHASFKETHHHSTKLWWWWWSRDYYHDFLLLLLLLLLPRWLLLWLLLFLDTCDPPRRRIATAEDLWHSSRGRSVTKLRMTSSRGVVWCIVSVLKAPLVASLLFL